MDTSKAPDTTRKVPVETSSDEDEKEEIRMPAPPADWAFNDLLVNIANEMTEEDLDEAKSRFKGTFVVGNENKLSLLKLTFADNRTEH